MKLTPIIDLTTGMITAEDVFNVNGQLIIPKGIVLTENIINRLESYSIFYIKVDDEIESDLFNTETSMNIEADVNISNNNISHREKIRSSEQFKQFCQDFNECENRFKDNLMASMYRNEPFRANELVDNVLHLVHDDKYKISVFDILLNMSTETDSVYSHCIKVSLISNILAKWLKLPPSDQVMAATCGLFHDIGKFSVPESVLRKPGKLTPDEFEIIKIHSVEGYHILKNFRNLPEPVLNSALMHHEKCDGSGYPYGLKGNDIDRFAKIVTIADIYDAMTSDRVYRKALCPFTVIKHFEDEGLQKYEPGYILTFLENVSNSYLHHRVSLSNGMEGNVIFINSKAYSRPIVKTDNNEIINLQTEYYNNIMNLSKNNNISIETII